MYPHPASPMEQSHGWNSFIIIQILLHTSINTPQPNYPSFPLPIIIILNSMIVKNRCQLPFGSQKPYFLQGLDHARQILVQLKRQKDQDLQYSPIARKHTKLSSDAIIEQEPQLHHEEEQAGEREKEGKDRKKQRAWDMGRLKLNKHKKMRTQSYDEQDNEAESMQTTKYKYNDSSLTGEEMELNHIEHKENPNQEADSLHKRLQLCQSQINDIGNKLESTHSEIQTYQIIFDNLCDCYRANHLIYNRNHKLRRQALRLEQEKNEILTRIQQLSREAQKMDQVEKCANQFISKVVRDHVRDLCAFNQDIVIESTNNDSIAKFASRQESEEQEQEENYDINVKLNYRKLKQRYDEKAKKKGIADPKKLQKGVSFEEEIDVMSKYYESELSHI